MAWQINPYALPLFIVAFPMSWIALVAWRHQAMPAVRYFFFFIVLATANNLSYGMELMSANLGTINIWLAVEHLSHWSLIFWLLFAASYAGYDHLLTRRRVALLFVVPALALGMMLSNAAHGLVWSSSGVTTVQGLVYFDAQHGPVMWLWTIYAYALVVCGTGLLIWRVLHSPELYRGQVALLVSGMGIAAGAGLLTMLGLNPAPHLDLLPYGIGLAALPLAVAVLRFRFLDIGPTAYHHVFESVPDPVLICDPDCHLLESNEAARHTFAAQAPLCTGLPITALLPMLDWDELRQRQPRRRHPLETTLRQEIQLSIGGDVQFFDTSVSPMMSNNQHTGWVVMLRQTTALHTAQDQMLTLAVQRERVAILETFIHNVSHDLRTPLTIMNSSSYVMERLINQVDLLLRQPPPLQIDTALARLDKLAHKVGILTSSTKRLSTLVERMLEMAEIENAAPSLRQHEDLNAVVAETLAAQQSHFEDRRITVSWQPAPQPCPVMVDLSLIRRALTSLIENAFLYTDQDGSIDLTIARQDRWASLHVTDSGCGINETDLPHIFDGFYRADSARQMATGGSGLGLTIARRIVVQHSGTLHAYSAEGEGSTFVLTLPLAEANSTTPEQDRTSRPPHAIAQ